MKRIFITGLLLFIFLIPNVIAQSVWFTSPGNGQTITSSGYGSSQTTIPVYVFTGYTITPYPPEVNIASAIKLFTSEGTYDSRNENIPEWFYLEPGVYQWRVELHELFFGHSSYIKTAEQTITFYVKHTISVTNNFGGGDINIDGGRTSSGSKAYKFIGETLTVGAIDQHFYSYNYTWNQSGVNNSFWQKKTMGTQNFSSIYGGTPRNYTYTVASNDNGAEVQGVLKKMCNVTFQNNFVGVGNGGVISVNNTQYNSPTSSLM